jgi:hypothetical protein
VQLPEFAPGAVRAEGCGPWHKIALGCGGLLVLGAPLVDEAPVQTGGFDFDTVYALFSRGFMDESRARSGPGSSTTARSSRRRDDRSGGQRERQPVSQRMTKHRVLAEDRPG